MGVYTTIKRQPLVQGVPFYKCDYETQTKYEESLPFGYVDYEDELISYKNMYDIFKIAKDNFETIKDVFDDDIVMIVTKENIEKFTTLLDNEIEALSKTFDFYSLDSYYYSEIYCFVELRQKLLQFIEEEKYKKYYLMVDYG